ncbi:6-phosphogluconolactonase [Arthrobacter sp. Hiyo8]|nr:6-phosphogluconolactonase [Arthrobacter sp. Hiyo8]
MAAIAARLITKLVDVQDKHGEATVVLTGGTVGIGTLKAVADSPAAPAVDWSRVNFWWGDERFVGKDSTDRNTVQAREALLSSLPVDPARVHEPGSSDEFATADEAAADYAAGSKPLPRPSTPRTPRTTVPRRQASCPASTSCCSGWVRMRILPRSSRSRQVSA